MITPNNFWSKRVSLSLNTLILKELKESQPPLVLKSCQPLTAHKEETKFWEHAIPSRRSCSARIESLDSQDARETKPVPLSWEVHLNTFLTKLKDLYTMPCVFWSKPSRTKESFMVEETQKSKWLWNAKSSPRSARVKRVSLLKPTEELWEPYQPSLQKMQDLMPTSWSTIWKLNS